MPAPSQGSLPEGAEPSLTSPNLALRPAADDPLALGPALYRGVERPQQGVSPPHLCAQ